MRVLIDNYFLPFRRLFYFILQYIKTLTLMKKILLFLSLLFGSLNFITAQNLTPGIKWQKSLSDSCSASKILKSKLGGYILAGRTNSNAGWVVKTDEAGNIIWQKRIGSNNDLIQGVDELENGDIIVIGRNVGVTRLDRNGNIKWSKSYGMSDEQGKDIKATEGGFIFITGFYYPSDTRMVKINDLGDIIWDKKMGRSSSDYYNYTTKSLIADANGEFVLYGETYSSYSSTSDLFLSRFNEEGNLVWTNTYHEDLEHNELATGNFIKCKDGGYVLVGRSPADPYVPTDFDLSYVVKTSSLGYEEWHSYMAGEYEYLYDVTESAPNEFVFCGDGNSGGLIIKYSQYRSGWKKYIPAVVSFSGIQTANDYDFVLISGSTLMEVTSANSITGYTFIDNNFNGQKDPDEKFLYNVIVSSGDGKISTASSSKNGYYMNSVDTGQFTTNVSAAYPYYTIVPDHTISSFTNYNNSDVINFAFQPLPGKKDAASNLYGLTNARPGFDVSYEIEYENIGTADIADGSIQLIKDPRLSLKNTMPNYASVSGDTIRWNYAGLKAADIAVITVNFTLAAQPVANVGETLHSYLSTSIANDLTPENNNDTLNQIVIGSFDPNDKKEKHGGTIYKSGVAKGDWLTYTIRFQNSGNDTAFNIIIRDTLDSKLDWNSLEMVDASHNYQLNINDGNKCVWYFNNVLLPDSNVNEHASHGYLVYRIRPKASLLAGDVINNTASIYFDNNLPVQTNTEKTIVANDLVLPLQLLAFSANHNGKANLLKWSTAQELNTYRFEIQRSSNSRDFISIGNVKTLNNGKTKNDYAFTDAQPLKAVNYYRLKLLDKDGKFTYSSIRNINNSSSFDVVVYPNPVHQNLTLSFNAEKAMDVQIEIVNSEGKKVYAKKIQLPSGASMQNINIHALSNGNYFMKCFTAEGQTGLKFVKQ
jgi:uncharacterized repeat protein (TIGR01451 family)